AAIDASSLSTWPRSGATSASCICRRLVLEIIVNHLTRMKPGYICVAGIEPDTGKHIRPVLRYERLDKGMLAASGGPFDIASVVELGSIAAPPRGAAPHVEDLVFVRESARGVRRLTPEAFWHLLDG